MGAEATLVAVTSGEVTQIAIGAVVVVLLIALQLRTRPVRERSSIRLVLVLGVIGVIEISQAASGHNVRATTVGWVVASLVAGAALGVVRALTVTIWREGNGRAMRRGTVLTGALWVVSFAVHLAFEAGIDHSTKIAGFGASTVLVYLAVTLASQREVLRRRAAGVEGAFAEGDPGALV